MPNNWATEIWTGTDVPASKPGVESQTQFLKRGIVLTKNGAGFILLRRGRLDKDEAVEVWHTNAKIDTSKIEFWHPYSTTRTTEYLGQDKWGYTYINTFLSEGLTPEWPTAKQDIIKSLEIKTEGK